MMKLRYPIFGFSGRARALLALVLLIAGLCSASGLATAQSASSVESAAIDASSLSPEERREMLARLTDAQVRELVWNLMSTPQDSEPVIQSGFIGELTQAGERLRGAVAGWVAALGDVPAVVPAVGRAMVPEGAGSGRIFVVLLFVALVVAGGLAAQWAVRRYTSAWVKRWERESGDFVARFGYALLRLFVGLVEVGVFVGASAAIFLVFWQGHEPNRFLIAYTLIGMALVQAAVRVSTMLWSPDSSALRLVPVADGDAHRVHRIFVWVAALGIAQFCVIRYLRAIGIDASVIQVLTLSLALLYVVLINVWMWKIHIPLRDAVLSGERQRGPVVTLFANTWPLLYGILTVAIYLLAVLAAAVPAHVPSGAGFSTLLLVVALPFVLGLVRPLVDGLADRRSSQEVSIDETVLPRAGFRRPVTRVIRFLLIAGALSWATSWWGFDLVAFVNTRAGTAVGQGVLQILVAIVIASVLWSIAKRAIDPHLEGDGVSGAEVDEVGGGGVTRIATLLPLIRKTIFVVLVVMTAMIVLSSLGVNIGPLLAGAGVVGIAVGFGAQSLVTDIISGIFFLMDDAFRRGEYVDIGGVRGSVEKISLRSFQLRHHNGPLHTMPYGQIGTITNYSRDYAIMKFEIRVPFEVDVDRVRKLIKKVGQQMMEDPEIAEMLLEPLKSQGVNRMDDSAFIVRCKFTAKPGKQFVARRMAYTKIQEAFQREGIQFAPRRVIVETTSKNIDPNVAAGAAAAASGNEEQQS